MAENANQYKVHLHRTEDESRTVVRTVHIPADIPIEKNDEVAGGIAVHELWEAEGVLYAVGKVEGDYT